MVELLVCLCILAILIAVALPSLSKIRQRGQAAQCVSNLRQLGAAALAYAGENNGLILPLSSSDGSGKNWSNYLYESGFITLDMIQPGLPSVLVCPSLSPHEYPDVNVSKGQLSNSIYGHISAHALPKGIPEGTYLHTPTLSPSRQILFADAGRVSGGEVEQRYQFTLGTGSGQTPLGCLAHGGAINLGFVDGHVESVADIQILKDLGFTRVLKPDGTILSIE